MFEKFRNARATLSAYSSDASIYAIRPISVISPDSAEEIAAAVYAAQKAGISVTARGGGTGLSGGAIGPGIILDFGNLRSILEFDAINGKVKTEPGIIFEELNLALKKYNLFFPPDPSSGDSCQIGGMIANNSSGPRSVKYGLTSDFVEEISIVKPDGKTTLLKKIPAGSSEVNNFYLYNPEYRKAFELIEGNQELILDRWPRLKKNSAGYNLRVIAEDLTRGILNFPALIVGSEGTLGLVASATLRLLPIPREILTCRLYFHSLVEAGRAVKDILTLAPSGLEIVDGSTLKLIGRERFNIPGEAAALLLVEFDEEVLAKRGIFTRLVSRLDLVTPPEFAENAESAGDLWKARKAIVPTLYRHHPQKRPLALIEDISIPPEEVPSFIDYAVNLFEAHHLTYGIFGHIGDGNLHIRPLFDLNDPADRNLAEKLYYQVYDRVISLGGSTTAEHADGRLRAALVRKMYGEEIYDIFRKIKDLLDPDHRFAPGVIISDTPFTVNIDYEKIRSYCAACGKCNGYCPAYDIFHREDFSPRGWLRMINQSGEKRKNLTRYLSYCLNCKNCATVCPAGVDIASEIIKYKEVKPSFVSKMATGFANTEGLLSLSLKISRVAEPLISSGAGRSLLAILGKPVAGLDRSAVFPKIAPKSIRQRFPERIDDKGDVAFFHGCADNLLVSRVGEAVFKVFDRLGAKVSIPEQKCCGLPYEVYGHRDNLMAKAKFNIDKLERFQAVITGCASCLLRLKDYKELFEEDDPYYRKAEALTEKCFDISQYILNLNPDFEIFSSDRLARVTYHNPCHLRAAGLHNEPQKLLRRLNNLEIVAPLYPNRCCAQAGSYGFLHFQESKQMFSKKKEDYAGIEAEYLATSCPACQMKIRAEMGNKFNVVHPVEILAERLK
ncbi:putative FAD/FMN-containing dehydrogenase, glycolate oxidase, fused subunits GlcD and GlcF [Candidatus Zixiibacteriota bacterium]|nr:putative FAD/FMN-containing dehydrogenase, glycolate oxidase, fused subunits GlcD and GlcF [candidate division Zixibacteria bacterium]